MGQVTGIDGRRWCLITVGADEIRQPHCPSLSDDEQLCRQAEPVLRDRGIRIVAVGADMSGPVRENSAPVGGGSAMIVFGPVPSRRLGRSLGINNIPPKVCSYACAYCQLGRTIRLRAAPQAFHAPDELVRQVEAKLVAATATGAPVDYLSFVPDGEPTLDANLGRHIELLRPLGVRIAVITNGSLLASAAVRAALRAADWVSVKVDAVRQDAWRRLDRPHKALRLDAIQAGVQEFAAEYPGHLVTETMLIERINDDEQHLGELAEFLGSLRPAAAYLSVPTRPPAEPWARAPGEPAVNRAYQIVARSVGRVECLTGYEGNAFASTGDAEQDLLSITAVHPMREDAVDEFLARAGADRALLRRLVDERRLVEMEFAGHRFYLRRLRPAGPGGHAGA